MKCFFIALMSCLVCSVAIADLYTGTVASLEWKTHSADVVLHVSIRTQPPSPPNIQVLDVFTRPDEQSAASRSLVEIWQPPLTTHYDKQWRPDGEWLLFVRNWNDRPPTIDHQVFLANPLQASWLSAVTAAGETLEDAEAILKIVKRRLASKDPMTEPQRRARASVDGHPQPVTHPSAILGTPNSVGAWLGGFTIPTDIDRWDLPADDRSFDEDYWVTGVIVPADESYRDRVLSFWSKIAAQETDKEPPTALEFPLMSLVNYPGKRTEELLMRLEAAHGPLSEPNTALKYLRFYRGEFDAEDDRLVGRWQLLTNQQVVWLDLMDDHQLRVHRKPNPFPHPNKHQRQWWARGRWNLQHGRLWVMSYSLRLQPDGRWTRQSSPSLIYGLNGLAAKSIAVDRLRFENGLELRRVATTVGEKSNDGNEDSSTRQDADQGFNSQGRSE